MKKTFFTSTINTMVFICLNIITNSIFIIIACKSIQENGQYILDFTCMVLFSLFFFGLLFNIHFAFLGMFSRNVITDKSISTIRIKNAVSRIKLVNIKCISITKEIKHYLKTVEKSIIIIEGYDELTKSNIAIKIDYRDAPYYLIIDLMDRAKEKQLKDISKYFDKHPK